MLRFHIASGDTVKDRDIELEFRGSVETLAAETLSMINTIYFRLKKEGDEPADLFKRFVTRGITTHGEDLWAADDNAIHFLAAAFERDQENTSE